MSVAAAGTRGDAPSADHLLYNHTWCHPHLYISPFLGCICSVPFSCGVCSGISIQSMCLMHQLIDTHLGFVVACGVQIAGAETHNIQGYNITLATSQVQEAIKQSKNNNSQGPDKLNIRHLKHIGPLGLAFLTSMFKTALNKNIIPHTWKLANIVPIPKPNKDTDKGTSYRPISLLSVIAKTLEKSLLPYITANIPNTPMQHGYKTQHSTVTALHTLNNTVAKGFNQMAPLREQSL